MKVTLSEFLNIVAPLTSDEILELSRDFTLRFYTKEDLEKMVKVVLSLREEDLKCQLITD